jgi:hypothetical protein
LGAETLAATQAACIGMVYGQPEAEKAHDKHDKKVTHRRISLGDDIAWVAL